MDRNIALVIEQLGLDRLLEDSRFHWDLRQGVIFTPAKTRVCLFSADLLQGVYKAIVDEAGEAWSLIFKRCGCLWGARLARRLDQEFTLLYDKRPEDMPVLDYVRLIEAYFACHGWGRVRLHLDRAQEQGVVEITLTDSIFAEIIENPDEMVEPLMSGIFASLLSHISRRELECLQTSCASKGNDASRFVVSAPSRIAAIAAEARAGSSHDQLVARL
jgi:predicted hydrocarbon binding protein